MGNIGVVDYGVGNVASIINMLKRIGSEAVLVSEPDQLDSVEKLILPGVGAFDYAAAKLRSSGMANAVTEAAQSGMPVLGVCLGMQLLLDSSQEGNLPGLGLIPGEVVRFPDVVGDVRIRVPHMGWNSVNREPGHGGILGSADGSSRFYFVHSFFAQPSDPQHVVATTTHGVSFASMIRRENVTGVQFHPEKSNRHGQRLLSDFARKA